MQSATSLVGVCVTFRYGTYRYMGTFVRYVGTLVTWELSLLVNFCYVGTTFLGAVVIGILCSNFKWEVSVRGTFGNGNLCLCELVLMGTCIDGNLCRW